MPAIMRESRINSVSCWRPLIAAAFTIVAGCGTSKVSQIKAPEYTDHSVRALVIAPSEESFLNDSSMLADAIGAELAKRGYSVVDTREATALLAKSNVTPADMLAPRGLAALGKESVDAVLSVSATGSSFGGSWMRQVKVKVTSTSTSRMIGEVDWTNSWGGMPGSPANAIMRKGLAEAAQEIAEALAKLLG